MKNIWIIFLIFLLSGCSYIHVEDKSEEINDNSSSKIQTSQETKQPTQQSIENFGITQLNDRDLIEAETINYLALGDSLTRGVGDEFAQYGFTGLISKKIEQSPYVLKVNFDNRGKNGRRSDQLLELIERNHYENALQQADIISISIGGNDVMKIVKRDLFKLKKEAFMKELDAYQKRYQNILFNIRKKSDAPIIMLGFYNPFSIITDEVAEFDSIVERWNEQIELLAEADGNACFVPIADLFDSNSEMVYHSDFFHPNAKGYDLIFNRVLESVSKCQNETLSKYLLYEG